MEERNTMFHPGDDVLLFDSTATLNNNQPFYKVSIQYDTE